MQRKPAESISEEARKKMASDLSRFFLDKFDRELSAFQAEMLVDFLVERIFPHAYNEALTDARAYLASSLEEMEDTLYKSTPRR